MKKYYWLLLFLPACWVELSGPSREREPEAEWRVWYRDLEACAGLRGDFDKITWVTVLVESGTGEFTINGSRATGAWTWPHTIYLGESPASSFVPPGIVRHEMLHDLIGRVNHGHPSPPFGRCAE